MATEAERFPVPTWLSPQARALYEKGPVFLASNECLIDDHLDAKDWLPAYCAHTIPGFLREHISPLQAPEVIQAFGSCIASPLLTGDHTTALEYLKTIIETAEEPWQVVRRRQRPPPLPVGPPNDSHVFLFSSTQTFRLDKKIDKLYTKLAELSALLSSGELAHSKAGWVTLNTLNAYTGPAVPGNFDPQSQSVVDSKPFTLTHQSFPLKLDDHLLQAIVAIDEKSRRRFQLGSHAAARRKELVIRLTPQIPRSTIGSTPPPVSATSAPAPILRPTSPLPTRFTFAPPI